MKALAGLIRTFLEMACIHGFQHSQYHKMLFQFHVLEDRSLPNPGLPPFYSDKFFATIRKVHKESPLNVTKMTERQWYRLLLEDYVTMEEMEDHRRRFIPCRVEEASPENDWEVSWKRATLRGLGPESVSFLLKVLHQLLTTQERLSRVNPNTNPKCKAVGCPKIQNEDIVHALVQCPGNMGVGFEIMNRIRHFVPNMTDDMAVRLQFESDECLELPIVWVLAIS